MALVAIGKGYGAKGGGKGGSVQEGRRPLSYPTRSMARLQQAVSSSPLESRYASLSVTAKRGWVDGGTREGIRHLAKR